MQPNAEVIASNKKSALEQLRFSRQQGSRSPSLSTAPNPGPASSTLAYNPPAQSRDATVSSRFFPTTPSSMGNVLVPSSSPLTADGNHPSYESRNQPYGYDVAHGQSANLSNTWRQHYRMSTDPLSAPSGFIFTGSNHHASLRRQWNGDNEHVGDVQDEGDSRPRKRMNLGTTYDASAIVTSPPSPEIQRAGQKRRVMTHNVENHSTSSDDSLPDVSRVLAGPSKPRILRGRSPSPDTSTTPDPGSNTKFIRFKLTMPMESASRVQAAWELAEGDVKKATELLSDPLWVAPSSPALSKTKIEKDAIGRVKEIDEATKAQRFAVKEKGKKSLIYANRPILEAKPASVSAPNVKRVIDLTAPVPTSPESPVAMPRRKRIKKMVVDSDSEVEFAESDEDEVRGKRDRPDVRALEYFNTAGADALQELTGCTPEQAQTIIRLRPFESADDLNAKLGQGRKKAGPAGISSRLFEECQTIFEEYAVVDNILEDIEQIGATLRAAIATWTTTPVTWKGKASEKCGTPSATSDVDDGALSLVTLGSLKGQKSKDYLDTQPSLLSETVQLKEYQLLGVNWLHLLYRSNLSCILADEMGLGKTIQVISFLAYLKERGHKGPHLVVVPSSTLENWCREFARFAPSIAVQTYYAGKEERPQLRQTLLDSQRCKSATDEGWEVLVTTYNLAQGDDRDRKFFRRIDWDCCVYDEGHVLKNFQSQRYQSLLKFGSKWRLLLTGTPLQNNLQELVSLMNFILPHHFAESINSLRAIFKVKGDSKVTLLAQERVSRAKKMMTPFVLRRRKDQVLKDLPNKTERIEWCSMTELQQSIYRDALQRSRKTVMVETAATDETEVSSSKGRSKLSKKTPRTNGRSKYLENSTNVLMDLRKAASHPMLFRTHFTDAILSGIAKQLLKEPDFKKRGAVFDFVKEDMSVMTDAELQVFCATYKSTRKFLQDQNCYLDAGKVQVLLKLLTGYRQEGRKVLVFSQFTQILDILQAILKHKSINYLILTGSTPVDVRQTLVDEFTEDQSIPVFLLSTKAGGMGINLTAASVVIMFDQDFNPHNDRQAQDRAYRIGQKRDVEVVKLISRGTIEEDMLKLGETKLALDEAVAGDIEKDESASEREMTTSLMNVLRQQFEVQEGSTGSDGSI
ncbi:putative SNF2 family N-terminal domain containing protein [Lyophyllum shimeji]|uniref:DNA helicase n=1 Tax=Lyophyllum shimeji TaxID=47721 RepID=A0A9P3ULB2_LYOSH|nr:putative SNF2 family N-terminal domain containing protein [Lyophyllum shimeji]